jgi:hypothetical protein
LIECLKLSLPYWSSPLDVPEPLQGHIQIVDITDDATGKLHALARAHTPTYVNEVGHDSNLRSNVVIRDKNDRTVHYYVAIDEKNAMMKGDSVELLVNYGDTYEEVRERKGYGRDNKFDPIQRNLEQREDLENKIRSLTVYGMFELVEFLTEKIFDPIDKSIISGERAENSDLPWERVLVARRRLHWIGEKLERRVQGYLADSSVDANSEFISYIKHFIRKWQIGDHDPSALHDELKEEELYRTRSPSCTYGGLTHREKRSHIVPLPDKEFIGWFLKEVPRVRSGAGSRADRYWSHPDLPGVAVRSAKGMKSLTDFMSLAGIGVKEAYQQLIGVTKYFKKSSMNSVTTDR